MKSENAAIFAGFPAGRLKQTGIPEIFFTHVLPIIQDLNELKTALYAFWFFQQQEGEVRFITVDDFLSDPLWLAHLETNAQPASDVVQQALAQCCRDGILVSAMPEGSGEPAKIYFLNDPRGRAAAKACQAGQWSPAGEAKRRAHLGDVRPNIYQLYEQNIGPLTPLIADELDDAERTYPQEWIEEAVKIAVESNIRRWRYILAILRSWTEEGRHGKDQRDPQTSRKKYIQGEYGDFIER